MTLSMRAPTVQRLVQVQVQVQQSTCTSTYTATATARRAFHASCSAAAKPRRQRNAADPLALRRTPKFDFDDVPTLGHNILQRKREMLKYLRTLEWEVPKLEGLRETFKPPSNKEFLRFRFQHYQGEAHPASSKVVLHVDVDKLFASGAIKTEAGQHKLLLLAGERYRPSSGEVVIACERMPSEQENMLWCSDTLDKLIAEANTPSPELDEIPLDPRPELARQAKRRSYERTDAPTIKDFPKEWL